MRILNDNYELIIEMERITIIDNNNNSVTTEVVSREFSSSLSDFINDLEEVEYQTGFTDGKRVPKKKG